MNFDKKKMNSKKKLYTLVSFVDEKIESQNVIDVIPTSWLFKDNFGNMYSPFFDSPTAENIKELNMRVKGRKTPPTSWRSYRVEPKGQEGKSNFFMILFYTRLSSIVLENTK